MDEADKTVEVRPEIPAIDARKLDAMSVALLGVVNRKGAATLVINYGVNHPEAVLAWFGKRAAEEVGKVK